jgi:DUF1680 family protein
VTGQDRYLKLAEFFLEERGRSCGRKLHGDYDQDLVPIAQQREITGHAVRAMYLYAAVADVAAATDNKEYIATMDHIWQDVTQRKMYLTGGIGPSAKNEGFSVPYDLPNESAYAETCASIGMALWNQRMALLHADAKYADVVERVLYNGALSGVSLDGQTFFYVNPLASQGKHHRRAWFDCACCPVNVVRFIPTVGDYTYAHDGKENVYVNQYVGSRGQIDFAQSPITIVQQTRYPWDGAIKLTVEPQHDQAFTLHLRIPGWCQGPQSTEDLYQFSHRPAGGAVRVKVNGRSLDELRVEKGYAVLQRTWRPGDTIDLDLPMAIQRVKANPQVEADRGRVALERGPVVYCLEQADNLAPPSSLALSPQAEITAEFKPELLGGVEVLKGEALDKGAKPVQFTAVPYYAWDNRVPGQMAVWLPEDPQLLTTK